MTMWKFESFDEFARSKRGWVLVLLMLLMLASGVAGMVWYNQRPVTSLAHFRDRFDDIRDLEARWNAGILSLQLGIAPNYDTVTVNARDLSLNVAELEQNAKSNPKLQPLVDDIATYRSSLKHKTWLFDQVKASYAMLRNAVSVIPNAISDCFEHPDVLMIVDDSNTRISDLISGSMTGMMSFVISPTPLLRNAVNERLARTRAASSSVSPALAEAIDRFLAHVEVVVRERLRGNELMLAVNAVPSEPDAQRVTNQLRLLQGEASTTKRDLWIATAILSILFILTFVTFVYVISRRFLQLDKHNRILQQVNENAEEQLLQSAKLSALGQMVAGITHEINTPLAYVKAVFELIKERVTQNPDEQEPVDAEEEMARREELTMLLDDGLHGLEEMSTLIQTMKNFSRLDKGQIELFDVEEGIRSALLIARPQIKYVADVKEEFDDVPAIMASPTQLRQVMLNLIVNAADAMGTLNRRGLLTIRTRITSSDNVQIDICDNGPGIPEENLAKLFDPFFTTKPVGHGTGMGLSICYRIIENHGGTITMNSKVGRGTVITLTLPRQDEKPSENNQKLLPAKHAMVE